jgi:predicted dehydrogenase
MSPIGLAVVGVGYWGPNLVRAARVTPAFRLTWLCDRDLGRAQAALDHYTLVRATASYEQVLADPEVAAVAIATPAATHFDLVRAALEAGKHVLVEKPLTSSVAEAEKLVHLAQRTGLSLMCDHTYCYTAAVRRIRELIRSGEIGEIQFVDSVGPDERRQTLISYRTGDSSIPALPEKEPLLSVMAEFASSINEGRRHSPMRARGCGSSRSSRPRRAARSRMEPGSRSPVR